MSDAPSLPASRMPSVLAALLVFSCSAVVLVLEVVGVRLLAPFIGSSLDTYTAIIGTVLAGISVGTYAGGHLADRIAPTRLLGPVMLISGVFTLASLPVIRFLGERVTSSRPLVVVGLTAAGLLLPAALLSAVSPIVVKMQLASLQKAGSTVGRLSAIGTVGAIAGTFATGFILLAHFSTTGIVLTLGAVLVCAGVMLTFIYGARRRRLLSGGVTAVVLLFGLPYASATGVQCVANSKYACILIGVDRNDMSGRIVYLDRPPHSHVDLAHPETLKFWYVRAMGTVMDILQPQQDANMLAVGGGGFTLPRYLAETRPAGRSTTMELDPVLVRVNRERLELNSVPGLTVHTGDARATVKNLPSNEYDIAIADAFVNETVPWHLSTVEFNRDVKRTMTDDALLLMNVIDYGERDLLRSIVHTMQQVWPEVGLIERRVGERITYGNFVVAASNRPLVTPEVISELAGLPERSIIVTGPELDSWVTSSPVLTDDFAPTDQLFRRNTPY